MVKSIDAIRNELIKENRLSSQSIQDLKWYLENDPRPHMSIMLATDAGLKALGSLMAKHLEHNDDFIREVTVGCIVGRLFLAEYALKAFELAKNDPYDNVRGLAISNLGAVLDKLDKKLKKEIAEYIYGVISNPTYDSLYRDCAYHSVVVAMEIPLEKWPQAQRDPDIEKLVDKELLEAFRKKYEIKVKV
ncbi:MAG: hypothetical protein K0M45_03625 [Candidatus Paracaedibacteraceae bacterium]|nr:hypothetical protein [Candidatus Paracaedibacteraceae bacterium]